MGAEETVLVCPILGEQRGETLAVICLNGGGEGIQQIGKCQASHLVLLIRRDPFWTAVITKEPIMVSLTPTRESGTDPLAPACRRLSSQRSGSSGIQAVAMLLMRTAIRCSRRSRIQRSGIQRK
jgi:hypothetical protein